MTDSNKKVINPLLNVAVTGSTVGEFSQHALLLPAKERAPPPAIMNISHDAPGTAANVSEYNPGPLDQFQNQQPINFSQIAHFQNQQQTGDFSQITSQLSFDLSVPANDPPQFDYLNSQQIPLEEPQSNLSSVFSSFSSILKLKGTNQTPTVVDELVPPPAGIASFISENPANNAEPVPLFCPTQAGPYVSNSPKPEQGPVNTFRRQRLKRPVYAPVPGLSSNSQPPQQSNPAWTGTLPSNPSILSELTPSASPALSTSSQQDGTTDYFNPSTFLTPITVTQSTHIFTPSPAINFQSSVMAAIPSNEILEASPVTRSNTTELNGQTLPVNNMPTNQIYRPVYHHWFYKRQLEENVEWEPFSMVDSLALDQAFTSNDLDPDKVVATDGGRYDVNILRRQRFPIYWTGAPTEVRRCSWFHKASSNGRFVPYEENIANKLEEEFKIAYESNKWHRKVELPNGETVVFHALDVLVLLPPTQSPDAWGNTPNQSRPRVVKRGMDEFDISEGEPANVDHLLFLVHGIGSVCDLKFRPVEEVVDEFRSTSLQLVQSHYRSSCERGIVNRVEVLPIGWHAELHSEDTGIDEKLKSITLDSIPRLRHFTNDTLLDILFYSSPIYCQTIISAVGNRLNRTYELFKQRNPNFNGGVSLGGHSLGSLILFDLLCHQHPGNGTDSPDEDGDVVPQLNDSKRPPLQRRMSQINYMMGSGGTGQPQIHYPQLAFKPNAFFALGSPIGMFVTVRGLNNLGEQFSFPTCPAFFNIFHPYDPVAYRIESLINPALGKLTPVLIPHHKGRKRMHLELKETMARVGADLKQRVIDSMKSTWNSFYQLAMFHRQDQLSLEEEVDKAFKEQLREDETVESDEPLQQQTDIPLGLLNRNRRIDYVLQEAPFEFFNEYLFALTSHVCYWESEDTMLLILKEIYSSMNMSADDKIPQQSMTIERPPPSPKSTRQTLAPAEASGMDPTAPIHQIGNLGPPPVSGFVKKT